LVVQSGIQRVCSKKERKETNYATNFWVILTGSVPKIKALYKIAPHFVTLDYGDGGTPEADIAIHCGASSLPIFPKGCLINSFEKMMEGK